MVVAMVTWLAILQLWPEPAGPRWVTEPIVSNSGLSAVMTRASPPAMIASVALRAPASPPDTGASTASHPTCRPGNSPQPKEAQPLSHALTDIRLIHFLDFSARGLVRRWLLIGHFLILYYPTCRARARLQGGVSRAPKPASPGLGVDRSKGESGEHQRGGGGDLASQSRVGRGHVHLQMDLIGSNSIRSEVLLLLRCYPT
jgi:hypothetical protein